MKKIFTLAVLLGLLTTTFSQETTSSKPITRQDFLKASKEQKVMGWVFLGIGATAIAIAAPGNVDFETLGVLAVIGAVGTLASIPFFIASARNKRKAKALSTSFNMEKMFLPEKSMVMYYPSVVLKLNF